MPKMKTHSGAKKRFKITANGKVRGRSAFSSHILEKKSPKRKRHFAQPVAVSKHDERRIKTLLGAPTKSRRSRPAEMRPEAEQHNRDAGPEIPRRTSE